MSVEIKSDYNVEYLYKFKKGISTIKGGIKVLYDLEYPESIIEHTKKILSAMQIQMIGYYSDNKIYKMYKINNNYKQQR